MSKIAVFKVKFTAKVLTSSERSGNIQGDNHTKKAWVNTGPCKKGSQWLTVPDLAPQAGGLPSASHF